MAKAAAGECQRVVFKHGLALFGGMGFTWENELQRRVSGQEPA
jgi:alkylation response protein AidB-like acyl-CoA dehydrogenase